jgi:Mg2+ and Co2+ transporter CorA
MIVNSFQINDESQLMQLAPERAAEACQIKDSRIWLDVQTAEPGELEKWLDTLGIRGLPRRLCLEASDRSGYYMYLYFRRTGWFD